MEKNNTNNEQLTLGQQKRLNRKNEIAKKKRKNLITVILVIIAAILIIALIVYIAVGSKNKNGGAITADSNYSAQIDDDGRIKGVTASDYVDIPDYSNISIALADIEYTDEEVEEDIEEALAKNQILDSSEGLTAEDGDRVNIAYSGSVDGVVFDGGTSDSYDLELGSGTFIDDFEDQIVGHSTGDSFDVEVTFPEDYQNNPDLAGCDAIFAVTLNGIYVDPEFTDEFVAENLSEYASTAEEYRQYLKDTNYKTNIINYIQDYLADNSTLKDTPEDYYEQLQANYKYYEYSNYEYMNSLYSTYYGSAIYGSFADYLTDAYSMTEEEYDASLGDSVVDNMTFVLACQAIAEKENITGNIDEAREYYIAKGETAENIDSMTETYGKGYIVQMLVCEKVVDFISQRASVN